MLARCKPSDRKNVSRWYGASIQMQWQAWGDQRVQAALNNIRLEQLVVCCISSQDLPPRALWNCVQLEKRSTPSLACAQTLTHQKLPGTDEYALFSISRCWTMVSRSSELDARSPASLISGFVCCRRSRSEI